MRLQRLRYRPRRPVSPAGPHPRQGAGSPLLLGRGAPLLRPHACRRRAGLQHPVQLLQPQVRLLQRVASGRCFGTADAGPGDQEGARRRGRNPADDGPRHRRPRRPPGQPGAHLRDLPAALGESAGYQALRVDQWLEPAGTRRRDRQAQHRPRDDHHQLCRSRDRRQDLPVDLLEEQAYPWRRRGKNPHRAAAEGSADADRARHPGEGQFGADSRRQ